MNEKMRDIEEMRKASKRLSAAEKEHALHPSAQMTLELHRAFVDFESKAMPHLIVDVLDQLTASEKENAELRSSMAELEGKYQATANMLTELQDDLKEAAELRERVKELEDGISHAINMLMDWADQHDWDEPPGVARHEIYEKATNIQHHLQGTMMEKPYD